MEEEKVNMKNLVERISSPTPKFWKKVRKICLTLGAVGGALLIAPVALPAGVLTLAGYFVTAGAVGSALATLTKEDKPEEKKSESNEG